MNVKAAQSTPTFSGFVSGFFGPIHQCEPERNISPDTAAKQSIKAAETPAIKPAAMQSAKPALKTAINKTLRSAAKQSIIPAAKAEAAPKQIPTLMHAPQSAFDAEPCRTPSPQIRRTYGTAAQSGGIYDAEFYGDSSVGRMSDSALSTGDISDGSISGGYIFEREDSGDRRTSQNDPCGGYIGGRQRIHDKDAQSDPSVWERYGISRPQPLSRPAFANWSGYETDVAHTAQSSAHTQRSAQPFKLLLAAVMTVASITAPWWMVTDKCAPVVKRIALYTSAMRAPSFIVSGSDSFLLEGETVVPDNKTVTPSDTSASPESQQSESASADQPGDMKPVRAVQIGNTGVNEGSVWVKNSTPYSISISDTLSQRPNCKIKLNAGYQVLIIHTHTTECYARTDSGWYDPGYSPRTTDKSKNVVAVGGVISDCLEAKGIRTLHVTTVHDYPKYNGSYDRAAETISEYLKKYPSIEMVIDVHRDAMTQDDGTKLKPTVSINGKNAAQVMIISGCDAGGSLYFPGWRDNLCMAVQIQNRAARACPGLMRPLYFAPYRYNMHLTPNSLLVEFGTDVNTLDEAKYAAQLFGEQLAEQLLEYTV